MAVSNRGDLERLLIALLQNETPVSKPVRLLGVSLSSLQGENEEDEQLGLPIQECRRMISISRVC